MNNIRFFWQILFVRSTNVLVLTVKLVFMKLPEKPRDQLWLLIRINRLLFWYKLTNIVCFLSRFFFMNKYIYIYISEIWNIWIRCSLTSQLDTPADKIWKWPPRYVNTCECELLQVTSNTTLRNYQQCILTLVLRL